MLSKVNEANLVHVGVVIDAFSLAFLHGDGNIYHEEGHSKFAREFSNPNNQQAKLWLKFTSRDQIPTLEELDERFVQNITRESTEKANKQNTNANTPIVLGEQPVRKAKESIAVAGPSTEDILRAAAHLEERGALISDREDMVDRQALEIKAKSGQLQAKESELDAKARQLAEATARLAQLDADLKKREEAVAKASKKTTPGEAAQS